MTQTGKESPTRVSRTAVLGVVLPYATFASLWILLSDKLVAWLVESPIQAILFSTLKGWFFVGVTSLLLYGLVSRLSAASLPTDSLVQSRLPRLALALPFSLLALAISVLTASGILIDVRHQWETETTRLKTIAELERKQLTGWLEERLDDAHAFQLGLRMGWMGPAQLFAAGQAPGPEMMEQIDAVLRLNGFDGMQVLDEQGRPLWGSAGFGHALDPGLAAAARAALQRQDVGYQGPYRDAQGRGHLDFLVPIQSAPGRAPLVAVLHTDPEVHLHATLRDWPLPSRTGESLLFRRDGDQIQFVSELRHRAGSAVGFRLPLATPRLLSASFAQDPGRLGQMLEGIDYRGKSVLGVAVAVPHTDWFLLVKIDRAEVYADAAGSAVWIALVGLLALFMATSGAFLLRQREQLSFARALVEETARRRALIESSRDGILVIDQGHRVIETNQRFAEMLGYAPQEVIGLHTWDIEAVMSERQIREEFADFSRLHRVFESRHRRRDGSEYDVEVSVSSSDWAGQPQVLCICRDISERKRVEQALRESSELLNEMSAIAQIGAWTFDPATGEGTWTAEVARIHGVDPQRATNAAFGLSFYAPEDRARIEQSIRDAVELGRPYDIEAELIAADGVRRWVRTIGRPVQRDGRVVEVRGSLQDVTAMKLARDELEGYRDRLADLVEQRTLELRHQSLSLRAIIDNIPHLIWLEDPDGRLIAANRALAGVLGGPPAADPEMTPSQLAAARPRERVGERLARCKAGVYEIFGATVIDDDGSLLGTVGFARDITLEREMEQAREVARQAADAANRAKSAFLANMSHEIRTPMNAIVGLTYLLGRSGVTSEQAVRLGKIEAAARHLLSILDDILDLSKIEAGRMDLEQMDFSLMSLLDHARSLIADQARSKGLTVEIDADAVPLWLRGDPVRLRQALFNFAGNAVKFTERGRICLRAQLLEDDDAGLLIRFEVEDTGIGIAPDELPRLFAPFGQADVSTTRRHGGTGLGLAITRRLAQLMGGDAGVESELGRGSRFWFTARLGRGHGVVPVAPTLVTDDPEAELRRRHAGVRILLAEDNAINREVALELLHAVALAVDVAGTGREAVAKVAVNPYALVLMDIQMPEMDGLEATRLIRTQVERQSLPILAMTANAFAEDRQRCLDAGMDDFVPKPTDPRTLYVKLLEWLGGSAAAEGASRGRARPAETPVRLDDPGVVVAQGQVLFELEALLAEDNARALSFARQSAVPLRGALGAVYEEMMRDLARFDFESALGRLRARSWR